MKNNYLSEIYSKYYGHALKKCLNAFKNIDIAKDVTQDAFIKIFQKIDSQSFENGKQENKWVLTVIRNYIIDEIRKKKINHIDLNIDLLEVDNEKDVYFFDEEIVVEMIEKLSTQQKLVVKSHYYEGLSHEKIALKYKTSVSTSKTNLFKAKKNLKKHLLNYEKI